MSVDFTFRPLTTFPGGLRPADERSRSPFSASYSATLELLGRELAMLGVLAGDWRPVVLELGMREEDIRRDGLPRVHARPAHPGVVISFTGRHGPMRIACDRFSGWRANLRAIALGLEALRQVDRYGIARAGEQYVGFTAIGPGNGGEPADRGAELIRRHGGIREALKATHPDTGGKPEDFQAVMAARERARG